MYIVIIGCGRLGSILARELSDEGHDVSIIDSLQDNLDRLGSGFNGNRIKGVEFDNDTMLDAGIDNADVFLAMTSDDNSNIMASQIAKDIFRVPRVIARIFDPSREFIYRKLGLETISPTQLGAKIVKSRILEAGTDILATLDNDMTIVEVPITKNKYKTVEEIEKNFQCVISSIFRNGKFDIPSRDDEIRVGNKIICTINESNKNKLVSAVSREMII
jgi:trk system potassium uptake protein TrkA